MKRIPLRRALPLLVTSALALVLGIGACADDEPQLATPGPDGSIEASTGQETSTDDGSAAPEVEAGVDAGEELVDGGGLPPEDDGGVTDIDGGFDAGPACQPLTPGASVETTCSSLARLHVGGELTTATYQLASVTVFGSKMFCASGGGYVPYSHRGALRVTATSPTTATFEFLDQYRKTGLLVRPTTVRYDVAAAADKATLTFSPQACALKPPPASAGYSVGSDANTKKKIITLRLPYGSGSANYRYVEP